jgi:hypothetical protein
MSETTSSPSLRLMQLKPAKIFIPALIERLDLEGGLVSTDAMGW